MIKSDNTDLLFAALVAVQAEVGAIPKTSSNPFFKSKYADLATAKEVADPVATKHGLAVAQFPASGDQLLTMLVHTSGQYLGEYMDLHLIKNDPQSGGSAITYARRYAYMAALGLVADDDDDGNAASTRTTAAKFIREAAGDTQGQYDDISTRPFVENDPLDALDPGELFKRGNKPAVRPALAAWCREQNIPTKPIEQTPEQRTLYLARIIALENA